MEEKQIKPNIPPPPRPLPPKPATLNKPATNVGSAKVAPTNTNVGPAKVAPTNVNVGPARTTPAKTVQPTTKSVETNSQKSVYVGNEIKKQTITPADSLNEREIVVEKSKAINNEDALPEYYEIKQNKKIKRIKFVAIALICAMLIAVTVLLIVLDPPVLIIPVRN